MIFLVKNLQQFVAHASACNRWRLALTPGHSQILSHSHEENFHSCKIKSGSGLGTRLERVRTATGQKLCWFWRLTTTFFGAVSLFQHLLDRIRHGFHGDILPTYDFFEQQISCASLTFFRFCGSCNVIDIGYEYWKQSVLWNVTSLACEPKPTVCKLSKSRWSLLRASVNG